MANVRFLLLLLAFASLAVAEGAVPPNPDDNHSQVQTVDGKTFVLIDGIWTDTSCGNRSADVIVAFGSPEYLALIENASIADYLSVGSSVLLCNGTAIEVLPSSLGVAPEAAPLRSPVASETSPQQNPPATDLVPLSAIIPLGAIVFVIIISLLLLMLRRPPVGESDEGLYKVLSSETRRDILDTLQEGERTPTDISAKLNKSKATIVEHLDKLMEAKLVEKMEVDGRKWVFYKLTQKAKSLLRKGG